MTNPRPSIRPRVNAIPLFETESPDPKSRQMHLKIYMAQTKDGLGTFVMALDEKGRQVKDTREPIYGDPHAVTDYLTEALRHLQKGYKEA